MNIVEIIPSFYPVGGAERFTYSLSKSLFDLGHNVTVVSLYDQSETSWLYSSLMKYGVKCFSLGKHKGIDFKCALKLRKLLKAIYPDVIHIHLNSFLTAYLSGCLKQYHCFMTLHSVVTTENNGKRTSPESLLKKHLYKKKFLVPVSIAAKVGKTFEEYYGLPKPMFILNGVDVSNCRFDHSYAERNYDFAYVGRFVELKNPTSIIKAFAKLHSLVPSVKAVMVGDGPLRQECLDLIRSLGLEGCISLPGMVHNGTDFISNAKALILGSSFEGNPMVVNEAIACGTYVISTDVGGVAQVIDSSCGKVFPYSRETLVDSLISEMKNFLDNEDSIEKGVFEHIQENRDRVSIERCAKAYIDLFQKNLKKN